MDFMTAMDVGASALSAERVRLNVISMNLANAMTTRTPDGTPYRRRTVVLSSTPVDSPFSKAMETAMDREIKGVRVLGIEKDGRPFKRVYQPGHPDADKDGYVSYPDINTVEEMAHMLTTIRAYEANVASVQSIKGMYSKALELGK